MSDTTIPTDAIVVPGTNRVFKRRRILWVLLFELAVALMAISSINVALPAIREGVGASDSDIQLMLSGYALTFGVTLVAMGRIGDITGRSRMFVIGLSIFSLSSLGCALSHDPWTLNFFRLLQGVGAGTSSPQVNGIILTYFSGRKRAIAFSYFGLVVSVSVAVAPMLTGFLINTLGPDLGWRASFLWNAPIGLTAVILACFWLPFGTERQRRLDRKAGTLTRSRIDFDPVGMILLALTVIMAMAPFMLKDPLLYLLLIGAAICGYLWVRWERHYKISHEPMVDLDLFRYRSFTNAMLVSGTLFLGATSVFVILALYLQNGLGVSPLVVGIIGVPNAIAGAFGSLVAGRRVLDNGRTLVVIGVCLYMTGLLSTMLMSLLVVPPHQLIDPMWLAVPLAINGFAIGLVNSANQTLSQSDIPPQMGGTAGAVKQVAERMGTAVGNAMLTAIFFAGVAHSWEAGFLVSFATICIILLMSLSFAIMDLKTLGNPRANH